MKEIPLSRGFVALVDDEDFGRLAKFRWRVYFSKSGTAYAVRTKPRPRQGMKFMHREILGVEGAQRVDHRVHHEELRLVDNRRANLRVITIAAGNQANQRKRRATATTSRFKGASRYRDGRWLAMIRTGGRGIYLGYHPTEALAARAYDIKAVELFGDFALTNFPVPGSKHWLYGPGDSGEGSVS